MAEKRFIDVRPILADGGCPFDTVLEAAKDMKSGDVLSLQAPFNPIPLQQALAGIGIDVTSVEQDEDSFVVNFRFTPIEEKEISSIVDLTDLEPPEPMVRISESLATAQPGVLLAFKTRFKPVHLLNSLDKDSAHTVSDEQEDGTWVTRILKREVVKCKH